MIGLSDPAAALVTLLIVAPIVTILFCWLERFNPHRDDDVPGVQPLSHVQIVPRASIGEEVRNAHALEQRRALERLPRSYNWGSEEEAS